MAKKMKVVVRRKDAATEPAPVPGACILPFGNHKATSKKAESKKRAVTPRRKRATATTSSNASSDPLAKESAPNHKNISTDFDAWESFHKTPVFPDEQQHKQQQKQSFADTNAFSVGGESSTQPLSWGSSTTASQRTTPSSPDRSVEQLLTLPAPTDRSERRRGQYEREKRQKGLYEGEMEPAGIRGQEAQVKKSSNRLSSSSSTTSPARGGAPQIRSFDENRQSLNRDRKNFAGKQVALVLPALKDEVPSTSNQPNNDSGAAHQTQPSSTSRPQTPTGRPHTPTVRPQTPTGRRPVNRTSTSSTPVATKPQVTTVDDGSSESSSQLSSSQLMRKEFLPPVQLHTETGRAVRGPVVLEMPSSVPSAYFQRREDAVEEKKQDDFDDESTKSDEELRQMQPDLIPSFSADNYDFNLPKETARSHGPSPAAAAAAAAAAATLQQPKSPDKLVEEYNEEAMNAVEEGRLNDAVELFGKVLNIQKKAHGDKHATVASAYHNLGTVQAKRASALSEDAVAQQLCRTAALEAFQAAARTARDSLGPTHPNVAVSLVRIGFLLLHSKQYSNALITFAEALRIRLAAFGKNHALTANLYNNLGVCHMHMEEFEQGRRALHTGLGIQRKLCAESDARAKTNGTVPWLELADTLFNIGGLCLEWIRKQGPDLRRAEEGEDSFAEAYEVSKFIRRHVHQESSFLQFDLSERFAYVSWDQLTRLQSKWNICLPWLEPYLVRNLGVTVLVRGVGDRRKQLLCTSRLPR